MKTMNTCGKDCGTAGTSWKGGEGMGRAGLIMSIIRLLNLADDEALSNIYHFVLHRV